MVSIWEGTANIHTRGKNQAIFQAFAGGGNWPFHQAK